MPGAIPRKNPFSHLAAPVSVTQEGGRDCVGAILRKSPFSHPAESVSNGLIPDISLNPHNYTKTFDSMRATEKSICLPKTSIGSLSADRIVIQ